LKKLLKMRASAPPTRIGAPMMETDEQLTDKFNGLIGKMENLPGGGGRNPIYQVRDASGELFIIKHVKSDEEIYSEVFSTALFNDLSGQAPSALGGRAPTARMLKSVYLPAFDLNGNPIGLKAVNAIVYRFAEGVEVGTLTEPQILALKDQLAALRAFRLWLCDTDGHMRNFKLSSIGDVTPLDFGWAHLRKERYLPQIDHPESVRGENQKQLMQDALKFNTLVQRAADRGLIEMDEGQRALYNWIDRIDGMLSYDDMAPMVDRIKALCANRAELEKAIRRGFGTGPAPDDFVKEAADVLVERGEVLDTVLKGRFKQYKKTAPASTPVPPSRPLPLAA